MIHLLDRHWLLTSTTYGTWLLGDVRGFVSPVPVEHNILELHNIPGEPYDSDMPTLEEAARRRLKGPPIRLSGQQAHAVCDQFLETARYRGWVLLAASVMANHVHAVLTVAGDPEPSKLQGDLKAYASRKLTAGWGRPQSETWWTHGGSKRKLPGEFAVCSAVRYTLHQIGMLARYAHPELPGDWLRDPDDETSG
jgi:REP element-mobilizing transposase RayT